MTDQAAIEVCRGCGTQLAPAILACPGCARLVHAAALEELAAAARAAQSEGDISGALQHWRSALELLPDGSRQHEVISAKITALGERVPFAAGTASRTGRRGPVWQLASGAGAIGLLAWKLKALVFGLAKGSTLLSMLLSLGVYWSVWGWKFALGIVLSIYVHEMGHVIALRRYGFKAGAPMFVPGLGALIRLQQKVVNGHEDAVIGLAGPIYGLGAAMFSLALWWLSGAPIFAAIAGAGAWINLFNLLPIGSLDGGRGFHAMSRSQKLLCAVTAATAWYFDQDGLLMLLAILCVGRALTDRSPEQSDRGATTTYCLLVVLLTAVATARHAIDVDEPFEPAPAAAAADDGALAIE